MPQLDSMGLGPCVCSVDEVEREYTVPMEESAIIRSREMARLMRFLPFKVVTGLRSGAGGTLLFFLTLEIGASSSGSMSLKARPHCSRSPCSLIAAPKPLVSFKSLSSIPSNAVIHFGFFTMLSFPSGLATLPSFAPHTQTPGFSQLFRTCRCWLLSWSRDSSLERALCARFCVSSKTISAFSGARVSGLSFSFLRFFIESMVSWSDVITPPPLEGDEDDEVWEDPSSDGPLEGASARSFPGPSESAKTHW